QVRVPSGTGTVDVRVQSGVTTAPNADNIKSTIFGYGVSATTAADRFTFGSGGTTNQAPTLATAASATPTTFVLGQTTILRALGADDGGEPNLRYTWTVAGPSGVTYSANGTNAAKTTTASFTQAG